MAHSITEAEARAIYNDEFGVVTELSFETWVYQNDLTITDWE